MKAEVTAVPETLSIEVFAGNDVGLHFGIRPTHYGPVKIVRVFDPGNDRTWGYVAVDNLARGPSLGGIRMAPDVTAEEVYGLAAAMTFKSAAAMLPLGGGKAGIIASPSYFAAHPDHKSALMTAFGKALFDIPEYVPGPDMGTCEEDMQLLYEVFTELTGGGGHGRGGVGRPPDKGGLPLDEWGVTAHGLFAAACEAEDFVQGFKIEGAHVVVQGFGNVGSHIADKLREAGAVIIGASDINRAVVHSGGLDVDELIAVCHQPRGLGLYAGPVEAEYGSDELDRLLEVPCDVLVPAARPDAITCGNADRIDTCIVLQGANNPVHGAVEYYLNARKGIVFLTDWVVNAGGVIACAAELKMDEDPAYREQVLSGGKDGRVYIEKRVYDTISQNVREIFERRAAARQRGEDTSFREQALELAKKRLTDDELRTTVWL